jgi:hypothetical protein
MRTIAWLSAGLLIFGVADDAFAGKKKKKKDKGPAPTGWIQQEGWQGACYFPENSAEMGPGDRKIYRSQALNEIMAQWKGEKSDLVKFDSTVVTNAETALFGKPDFILQTAADNLEHCKKWAKGGDTSAWAKWVAGLHGAINEGDCKSAPLDYTLFDYLDIGKGWQIPTGVCAGDEFFVIGSQIDYYVVKDGGPWINVEGDTSVASLSDKYPCNIEGCYEGMLIMQFIDEAGIETILPVGSELRWTAPSHGTIRVRINDENDTFFNNKYKIEGSMIHHTSVTYRGADAK